MQGLDVNEDELGRVEAIILSMTPEERRRPEIISGSRRLRIARGSGTSPQQVNQLLSARKQMQKMLKAMGQGKRPNIQSLMAASQGPAARRRRR
jgi:signal recognition particle subunit SRP54